MYKLDYKKVFSFLLIVPRLIIQSEIDFLYLSLTLISTPQGISQYLVHICGLIGGHDYVSYGQYAQTVIFTSRYNSSLASGDHHGISLI